MPSKNATDKRRSRASRKQRIRSLKSRLKIRDAQLESLRARFRAWNQEMPDSESDANDDGRALRLSGAPIPSLYFETHEPAAVDALATDLAAFSCRGWVQQRPRHVAGRIQCPEPLREAVIAAIGGAGITTLAAPQFEPGLRILRPATRSTLDERPVGPGTDLVGGGIGLTQLGAVRGWAVDFAAPAVPVTVRIAIDGEVIAEVPADGPRQDVAEGGFGTGRNGFLAPLPRTRFDGREVEISFDVAGREVRGDTRIRRRLPLLPTLAARPWVGASGAPEEAVRQATMAMEDGWRARLAAMLDGLPAEAMFRDWGVAEGFARRGLPFRTCEERMLARRAQWFLDQPCSRGDACCKHDKGRAWEPAEAKAACPLWPRHFASKAFTKRYAESLGIRVPRTFAATDTPETVLPTMADRYVMKPEDDSGHGLFLMHDGVNLFDRRPTGTEALLEALATYRARRGEHRFLFEELVVQEGVDPAAPVVPLDYKLHVFGGRVRIIHIDDRNRFDSPDPLFRQQSWYTRDWDLAPVRMREHGFEGERLAAPRCAAEMIRLAEAIGRDARAYVRVDFYATDDGPVLGEITPLSFGGVGFTAAGDALLSWWLEVFEPDLDPRTAPTTPDAPQAGS